MLPFRVTTSFFVRRGVDLEWMPLMLGSAKGCWKIMITLRRMIDPFRYKAISRRV